MSTAPLDLLLAELRAVRALSVAALCARLADETGVSPHPANRTYLRRRLARILEARARPLATDARSRRALARAHRGATAAPTPRSPASVPTHDPRVPPVGSVLRRRRGEREIEVRVARTGFVWEGRRYRSLSAIAREATGQHWGGPLWFGLRPRQRGPRPGRRPS